jgi:hypothetical protein
VDLENKTLTELEKLRDELEIKKDNIKHQLDRAKAEAVEDDIYAPAAWFADAQHALRCSSREFQKVVKKIADAKKDQRRRTNQAMERTFVDVCRERLDKEQFQEFWRIAMERFENAG